MLTSGSLNNTFLILFRLLSVQFPNLLLKYWDRSALHQVKTQWKVTHVSHYFAAALNCHKTISRWEFDVGVSLGFFFSQFMLNLTRTQPVFPLCFYLHQSKNLLCEHEILHLKVISKSSLWCGIEVYQITRCKIWDVKVNSCLFQGRSITVNLQRWDCVTIRHVFLVANQLPWPPPQ